MRSYREALEAYKAECMEISDECVAEGYPSNGSVYDLRVTAIEQYYPELFGDDEEE